MCVGSSEDIQAGISILISRTGNSKSISAKIRLISFSVSSVQLTGITGTPYFFASEFARDIVSGSFLSMLLSRMIKGLFIFLSSLTVFSSASSYSARFMSLMVPSVVTKIPIVEWSVITFWCLFPQPYQTGLLL